jgi:dipeptidyl aminopeptidase/acylaminoacyl peptidase
METPLIPRKILFGNPERMSPQMSPDGQWIAFLAPDERDVLQVWLRTVSGHKEQKLTADPKRGIRSFFWTYLPNKLVYLQDQDGDENFHLHCVDVQTHEVRDLTPFPGVRADVIAVEPNLPSQMLVALNRVDPRKHDVYRLDLNSGESTLDVENPGNVLGWVPDAELRVRAALAATPDGGHEVWWREASADAWKTILTLSPEDQGQPLDFSADGQTLYLLSSHAANTQRLVAWEARDNRFTVLAEDTHYDVGGIFMHPTRRVVQAVSFNKDKVYWLILDPTLKEDFNALKAFQAAEFHLSHGDLADTQWLVTYTGDTRAASYYVYTRATKTFQFLFSQRTSFDTLPLVPMHPVVIKTRDHLEMHGYLSRAAGKTEPGPAVLLVHGGPWVRDRWGFNGMAQWLANRGYAVLQLNYRGSSGYGKAFLNAGDREWGAKMHDDLIVGVEWLIQEKIADPKRIAIMGGSYGGYAALAGLTFTPEVFACAVDIVGPSNLITLIQTIPPYWEPMKASFAKRVGDLKDEAFLKSRSPFFHVDRIKRPLLIGQGANDPRVKQAESDQIAGAMREKKLPVEYWVYTDEGHGFARPENRMHFYARVEGFLAAHLGGRAESPDDPVGHSAVQH